MKDSLSIQEMADMLIYVSKQIIENEPLLTEIDSQIGDGDHGIGMKRGFFHLSESLQEGEAFSSVNDLLKHCGIELLKTMGGASGVLFGTLFIGGLRHVQTVKNADLKFFSDFFESSLSAISERGKAKPGEKTMLDALAPAAESLKHSALNRDSLGEAFRLAGKSAREGMESTKKMSPKFGRARQYADKTIGIADPGATSVYIIIKSMSEWIDRHT